MSDILNAVTGRKKFFIQGDGVYSSITGAKIGIIENGVVKSSATGNAIAIVNSSSDDGGIDLSFITAGASDILAGKVGADTAGNPVYGSIAKKTAATYTPGTSNQTIAAGVYLSGVQTIKGDSNLKAGNIKQGVSIFGVTGTSKPMSDINFDMVNASESDVREGIVYVDGSGKVATGTMPDRGIVEVELTDEEQILPTGHYTEIIIPAAPESTGGIEFYECAEYIPGGESASNSFTVSGCSSYPEANGTYTRTSYIDTPDPNDMQVTATWTNEHGYVFEEYHEGGGSFYYRIHDAFIYSDTYYDHRLTDFSEVVWVDDIQEPVDITVTHLPGESAPESWTGYEMTQNGDSGAWVKSESLTENLKVGHLKPKVGEIYSADTSIRVRKMYDGAVYPIPSDGLVFYAPLQADYVDMVSGKEAVVTNGEFTEYNGLRCLKLDGSGYVKWSDNDDLPDGSGAITMIIMIAPVNQSSWKAYLSIGAPDNGGRALMVFNGRISSMGSAYSEVNKWNTIALVKHADNNNASSYMNGKFDITSEDLFSDIPDTVCACVGACMLQDYVHKTDSYVAFAAIYNRELTADEILEIHNALMEDVEQ